MLDDEDKFKENDKYSDDHNDNDDDAHKQLS